jgi:hypothetical protein
MLASASHSAVPYAPGSRTYSTSIVAPEICSGHATAAIFAPVAATDILTTPCPPAAGVGREAASTAVSLATTACSSVRDRCGASPRLSSTGSPSTSAAASASPRRTRSSSAAVPWKSAPVIKLHRHR